MPAAVEYAPDDRDLMHEGDDEWLKRESVHQRAEAWYDGEMPDVLKVKTHPKTGVRLDNNIKLNLFAKRIDRRRDFLFKVFPQLDIDDSVDESDDEKWLRECWQWNKAATLWGLTVQNGGFDGQVYMRLLDPRPGRDKYPRAILLSNVITWWQADDVDTHLWYSIHYKVGKTCWRQDIVDLAAMNMAARGWGIYYYRKNNSVTASWEHVTELDDLWEYDLGPIVTWQHWPRASRCYGAGEFGDVHLNLAYNRIASLGNAVIRNHAFPKTITDADAGTLTETAVDNLWTVPKGSQVWNLEMQSDLSALLNFMDVLKGEYNSQGRTVDIEGGPADFTNITNLAIKVAFLPQDDANEILQRQYGWALVEASKRLQMLASRPYEVDPKVVWKPSLPESKVEVSQVVKIEDELGIASKETQATLLGLDWLKEQKRMQDEQTVTRIRRFGQKEIAQIGTDFANLPNLADLKKTAAGTNGGSGG